MDNQDTYKDDEYKMVLTNFNLRFEHWVKSFQPEGDTSALRAVAWFWFSNGNDFALNRSMTRWRDFHLGLREGLTDENERFVQGLPRLK